MQDVNEFAKNRFPLPKNIQKLLTLQGNKGVGEYSGLTDNEIRKRYYQFPPTLFNVWRALNNREAVFMKDIHPEWKPKQKGKYVTIRPLRVYNTQSFDYHMRQLGGYRNDFKIYNTVFSVDWDSLGLPPANLFESSSWVEYRKQVKANWNKSLIKYDLVLDIDGNVPKNGLEASFRKSKDWAMRIHTFLEYKEIDHIVNFSGRNFHVRIPYEFVDFTWDEFYRLTPSIAQSIAKELKIPYTKGEGIDASIYDNRRIIKTLYSVSDMRVVLPVNEWQLGMWNLEDYEIFNTMKNVRFKNRVCEFRYNKDTTEALRGLVK